MIQKIIGQDGIKKNKKKKIDMLTIAFDLCQAHVNGTRKNYKLVEIEEEKTI